MNTVLRNRCVWVTLALAPLVYRAVEWNWSTARSVEQRQAEAGRVLFEHVWTARDPLAPAGDGLGPVFNAHSCVACHKQGGAGGGGPREANVTTYVIRSDDRRNPTRQGVVHTQATRSEFQETLAHVDPLLPRQFPQGGSQFPELVAVNIDGLQTRGGVHLSQRQTPALFGARLIDALPERVLIAQERKQRLRWGFPAEADNRLPVGRVLRLADGRVGRFGWKAQTASLADFVQAACANELGLGNPGQAQPASLARPDAAAPGWDLTLEQCNQLTEFIRSLPAPRQQTATDATLAASLRAGERAFHRIGCADCHVPNLDEATGIYSDLLLHPMGQELEGDGDYNDPPLDTPGFAKDQGPRPAEWRTPPLWGVADSAPYLHDGRAATLQDAITLHRGQGTESANRYGALPAANREALILFLQSLRAPR